MSITYEIESGRRGGGVRKGKETRSLGRVIIMYNFDENYSTLLVYKGL